MNTTQILLLYLCGAAFLVIAVFAAIGNLYSIIGIPNKSNVSVNSVNCRVR